MIPGDVAATQSYLGTIGSSNTCQYATALAFNGSSSTLNGHVLPLGVQRPSVWLFQTPVSSGIDVDPGRVWAAEPIEK